MILIETTPNLFGISLQGDYNDLNELYDSLSRYLDFYQRNNREYPYHEYEYLLSLNYDIRHAYQGDRNVKNVENNANSIGEMAGAIYELPTDAKKKFAKLRRDFSNGNLYFSVNILYPLVFHYMIALESIVYDEPLPNWFENQDPVFTPYDIITAKRDRTTILYFCSLLWSGVKQLFGKEKTEAALDYFENKEPSMALSLYADALLHCQLAHFPYLSEEGKKAFLLASFYEIMDADELEEYPEDYPDAISHLKSALEELKRPGKIIFPERNEMYFKLEAWLTKDQPLYREVFDDFLTEQYGELNEENEEPDW